MSIFSKPTAHTGPKGWTTAMTGNLFREYSGAYWLAAKDLVEIRHSKSEKTRGVLNFPCAYLYRHALELALKGIILDYLSLKGDEDAKELDIIVKNACTSHNLKGLAGDIESIVKRHDIFPHESSTDPLLGLSNLIADLEQHAQRAELLRYGVRLQQGEKAPRLERLYKGQKVDISALATQADGILQFLSELRHQLSELQDNYELEWLRKIDPDLFNTSDSGT